MKSTFIMTAFGKDRPGIVADVSEVIYEMGGNLEDSTMSRLADEFTLVLLFSAQGENLEETLNRECRRLEIEKRVTAFARRVEVEEPTPIRGTVKTITVEGLDQAGIVYKISRFLADGGVNIEKLSSRKSFSPQSGASIYEMHIDVTIPESTFVSDVESGLDRIGGELNVDIDIR